MALAPTSLTVGSVNQTTGAVPLTLVLPTDANRTDWVVVRRYSNALQNGSDPFAGVYVIVQQGTGTAAATINMTDTPGKSGRFFYDAYVKGT